VSNNNDEQFTSAIGLGRLLEKPEGDDLQTDAPIESYTIVCRNRSFGRIVRFSYETVHDAKKGGNLLTSTVASWGRMVPITKEEFYSNFFNRGAYTSGSHDTFDNTITGVVTDSSGDFIYDGKPFFAATGNNHPDKVGGSYYNASASNSLTHANLKTVYNLYTVTNNRDERGEVITLTPDVMLLNPALRFTAQEILNSTLIPGSMDNDTNVLNSIVEVLPWSYITGSDDWILGQKKMGLMATDRQDVDLDFWQDETSKDYFASIFTRFGGCVTNWRSTKGFPVLRSTVKNGVNCWDILLDKVRTISSQAWKVISLTVQRLGFDSYQVMLGKVISPRAPCSL